MNNTNHTKCLYESLAKFIARDIEFFACPLLVNIFLNAVLTALSVLGNGLIIVAIAKSKNLQTPSYLLLTSLAFTDLLVGVLYHPILISLSAFYLKGNSDEVCNISAIFDIVSLLLTFLSLVMSFYISIDRYLAIMMFQRYKNVVSKKRVAILITVTWTIAVTTAIGATVIKELALYWRPLSALMGLLVLLLTCVFYTKSFLSLRRYTAQVSAELQQYSHSTFNVTKYRRTLKTMIIALCCFLICFLPILFTFVFMRYIGTRRDTLVLIMLSFVIYTLSSSINPIIYVIRFKDIRKSCQKTLKRITRSGRLQGPSLRVRGNHIMPTQVNLSRYRKKTSLELQKPNY